MENRRVATPEPPPERKRWLDVHCHVFNAADVPLYEFIKRTRLRGGAGLAAPLLAIVAGGLRYQASSTVEELTRLNAGAAPLFRAAPPTAASLRAAVPDADAGVGLRRLRDLAAPRPESRAFTVRSRAEANVAPEGMEALQLFDSAFREVGIRSPSPGRRARLPAPPTNAELQRFQALIDPRSRSASGLLARYFRWGLMFTEDRNSLTSRLAALYDGQEVMLTPALVDYDAWLSAPDNGQPGQVRVMEAIAVQRGTAGLPVHAFLAFDPWRCIAEHAQGRDTLAELKEAVGKGAGIGVKLYPPMGFSAAGNTDRAAGEFPRALRRLTGGRPGPALDAVLDSLFDWAARDEVPIMAHCGQSNGSRRSYEMLAHPDFWKRALDAPGRRGLRVNLGHFGGIWDLGAAPGRDWARSAAVLMESYPNVHADVAYFNTVLQQDPATAQEAVGFLAELRRRPGSGLARKVMYGSDWSMIGQEEGSDRYPGAVTTALARLWPDDLEEDLRWRNAARYLGLDAGGGTRQRLAGLYERHGLSDEPLRRFSPTAA
ncbi:hypothetical protein [Roseomonas sp. 18066]|uniref:hypothetical protein n=1 Tax=Roseomonas sp. 18066 TaxID=2681412 RepID=UPI00135A1F40|nr:hypothetical protein [Roseomonas sp. 18066]